MRFLLIEDDLDVVEVVSLILESQWPDAAISNSQLGERGVQLVVAEQPAIVLLDIGLPDIDGFEVCKRIREFSNVPIVMLTVRDTISDVVRGFELGADDYITKPFRPAELVARIGVILRRVKSAHEIYEDKVIDYGGVVLSMSGGQVRANGEVIRLSLTEYQLLYKVAGSPGTPVANETLIGHIWGEAYLDAPHYLTSSITRLNETLREYPYTQTLVLREESGGCSLALKEGGIN